MRDDTWVRRNASYKGYRANYHGIGRLSRALQMESFDALRRDLTAILGPATPRIAAEITQYDPDQSWQVSKS